MIKIEIGKETFLTRRNNNIFSCNYDSFGNTYCPSNLAKADSYWDYGNGYSIESTMQVIDYTNKIEENTFGCGENSFYHSSLGLCYEYGTYATNFNGASSDCSSRGMRLPYANESSATACATQSPCSLGSSGNIPSHPNGQTWQNWTYLGVVGGVWSGSYQWNIYLSQNFNFVCVGNKKAIIKYRCPTGYTETTGSEISKGQCKKNIDYKYYNYFCSDVKNIQNIGFEADDVGGKCNKSDSDNTTTNPELSTPCNNSTPPTNNCKRLGFTCNSNEMKPAFVDGEWKCSPFFCDGNLKCGYGTCDLPSKPSLDKYQDVAYNPLQYISNNQCNGDICDYTINAKVSYCESLQCPKGDDIIQDSGKCYKLECPKGTHISGDKCIKVN